MRARLLTGHSAEGPVIYWLCDIATLYVIGVPEIDAQSKR